MPTAGGSLHPSLPPPRPKSPPQYPDLYGKRRELAKVQMLEREIGFLQEELKSAESLPPASRCCKEVADFIIANADPLIPTRKKISRSRRFWKWICGMPCFNLSWICCCCCLPKDCCKCNCLPKDCCKCNCNKCSCSCSNPCANCCCCRMPKCDCCSCWSSECFCKSKCGWKCCIPKCPSCLACPSLKCTCNPRCPKVNICSCSCCCTKKCCCFPCYLCC